MLKRRASAATVVVCVCAVYSHVGAKAQTPLQLTAQEYRLYMDWRSGKEDPTLAPLDEAAKLTKIARNLGVGPDILQRAIVRAERMADSIAADTESAVRERLRQTDLKGRVQEVHVDAGQGHVVAGVSWRCGDARDVATEAAYAAWAVGEAGQIVETLVVWCVNEIETKLFSATISRSAFSCIRKETIPRFANSRYIKLFEEVRHGPHR